MLRHPVFKYNIRANDAEALRIVGSAVGTNKHMEELLKMVIEGKVKPKIKVAEFDELQGVLERLVEYKVDGRIVVKIPQYDASSQ